jgi:hypothetical protein
MEKSVHRSSLTSVKCVKSLHPPHPTPPHPTPFKQACQTQKRLRAKSEIQLVHLDRHKIHITSKFICPFLNVQQSSDLIYPYSLKLMLQNCAMKIKKMSLHKCQNMSEPRRKTLRAAFCIRAFSLHGIILKSEDILITPAYTE